MRAALAAALALAVPVSASAESATLRRLQALADDPGSAPRAFHGQREHASPDAAPTVDSREPIVIREDLVIGTGKARPLPEPPKPEKLSPEAEHGARVGALKGTILGTVIGAACGAPVVWALWGALGPFALLIGAAFAAGGALIGRDVGKHCGADPTCS